MTIDGCVYLMRHGCTALDTEHRSDGWLDMPLSAEGQLSVIPAQQCLKTEPIACIYAPDLKRTMETAHLVASGTLSKPRVEEANDSKTWNLGVLAGTHKRYGRPAVKRLIANPDDSPLGGESFNTFKNRFLPWFHAQLDEAIKSGEPILIVCSGSNLRLVGQELFNDADSLDLDEGGLVALYHSDGAWHEEVLIGAKDAGRAGGKHADMADGAKAAMDDALDDGRISS